jgi:hypothetical protein
VLKNAFELTKTAAIGTRKYFLIAPTPQEKTAWVKDLTAAIEQAAKNKGEQNNK